MAGRVLLGVAATALCWTTVRAQDTIPNRIVVDSAWFDTSRNHIVVTWQYSDAWVPPADSVEYGYAWGLDSVAARTGMPGTWYTASGVTGRVEIELGEGIVFDTVYYVALRLRPKGGSAGRVSDSSMGRAVVGPYTWEPFVYFRTMTGDTVRAFNDHVQLWFEGMWAFGSSRDTVEAYPLSLTAPPGGYIPMSVAVRMRQSAAGPSLTTALRWDSIPVGYNPADVRMCHWSPGGQWTVYQADSLYASQGLVAVRRPLTQDEVVVLMVDTSRPPASVLRQPAAMAPHGCTVQARPSEGLVTVDFGASPGVVRAELQLLDLRGREVWKQQVSTVHPGRNRISWQACGREAHALRSAGNYALRLYAWSGSGQRVLVEGLPYVATGQ